MPFSLTVFLPKVLSKVKGVNVDPLLVAALNWICLWRSDPSKTASVTDVTESATQPDLSSSPRVSQPSRLRLDVISRAVISRKFSGEAGSPLQGLEPFKVLPAHVEDFFFWQNKMSDLVANLFKPRPADCGSFLSWIWGRFSPFLNSKTSEPLALSNRDLKTFFYRSYFSGSRAGDSCLVHRPFLHAVLQDDISFLPLHCGLSSQPDEKQV